VEILTIAIPTFNRASKVARLLSLLEGEIGRDRLSHSVEVFVSNNASSDNTAQVLCKIQERWPALRYVTQPTDLGFDGNVRFLFRESREGYVWFMSDDDIPLPGALRKISAALTRYRPNALIFSFVQPPGSTLRPFTFSGEVKITTDPKEAVELLMRCPKISIYVLRRPTILEDQWKLCEQYASGGWAHVGLAIFALAATPTLCLAVISEPLATSDEEAHRLEWVPEAFLTIGTPFQHPFIRSHCPELKKQFELSGYCTAVQMCFGSKIGTISPVRPQEYEDFIRKLKFRWDLIIRRPKTFVQLCAIKLGIAHLWPRIKRCIGRP
jgi:hypothetical protein